MCMLTPLWGVREQNKSDFEWVVDMSLVVSGVSITQASALMSSLPTLTCSVSQVRSSSSSVTFRQPHPSPRHSEITAFPLATLSFSGAFVGLVAGLDFPSHMESV